ncbi:hypothetical protein ACE1ET_00965 [Saccharicrinis sp. FJH62]|uniref:hypothetical protein n=1 Tax=Saccharicrinis sp. FJH62 TaxID=3344657 RepID=UPI0035D506D6
MKYSGRLRYAILQGVVCLILSVFNIHAEEKELAETSQTCLNCHSKEYYSFYNDYTGLTEKKRMNPYIRIDSTMFLHGVHGTFSCDDCHSPDYATYPHGAELKLEFKYGCMDCHGGDPTYAHLHFDEIAEEANKSVHAEKLGDAFKCEMCHDPHTNKLVATSQNYPIEEIVAVDNNMCLQCHSDASVFHIYTESERPKIIDAHDWLPNQSLHFKNVRCLECHTAKEDTLMVSHNILPKEKAIKNCVECHSSNNLLQAKLYKYMTIESRTEEGLGSSIKNEAYVIGANRVPFLNYASVAIFALLITGILIHIIARIIRKK